MLPDVALEGAGSCSRLARSNSVSAPATPRRRRTAFIFTAPACSWRTYSLQACSPTVEGDMDTAGGAAPAPAPTWQRAHTQLARVVADLSADAAVTILLGRFVGRGVC